MITRTVCLSISAALAAVLGAGCSDDSSPSKVGPALEQTGKDIVSTTKAVGSKVGEGLSEAADSLEDFSKSVASNVSDTGETVAKKFQARLPDVESLVDKTKVKLNAAGAEGKQLADRLGDKLEDLKRKVEQLAKQGANATVAAKDDVVAAFNDLVANIKSGLAKIG